MSTTTVNPSRRAALLAVAALASLAVLPGCAPEPARLTSVKVPSDAGCQAFALRIAEASDGMVTVTSVVDGRPDAIRSDDQRTWEQFCDEATASGPQVTLQAIGTLADKAVTVFLEPGAAPNTVRIVG